MRVVTNIKNVKEEWDKVNLSDFLHSSFLEVFYINHPEIKHLFVIDKEVRLYAHIFKLNFNKTANYLNNKIFTSFISFIKFDVLYLTNTFITNIPSFKSEKDFDLKRFLSLLEDNYSLIIIPDLVFNNIIYEKNKFFKVEVEEDMILKINEKWKNLDDYIFALRSKYKKKIKQAINSSSIIEIRPMSTNDLVTYSDNIQKLFCQVIDESRFSGPLFNTNSFLFLIKKDIFKIYGYFINDNLVAFSSEFHQDKTLYSYYVGFDKLLNKNFNIYSRILIETINNAITFKMNKIVLGRTANEFKSNFGAEPIKSHIYIKMKNKYLGIIFGPIFRRLAIKKWILRNPFKKKQ